MASKANGKANGNGKAKAKAKPAERGTLTEIVFDLFRQRQGVTSKEIRAATGWPAGSAKWRGEKLAESRGYTLVELNTQRNGQPAYRLTGKTRG
jgi:hypothetical protein